MKFSIMINLSGFIILFMMCSANANTSYFIGDHICHRTENYTDIITTIKKEPVKVTKYEWCLEMPLRCAKYETEIREVEYLENVTKTRIVQYCCDDYEQHEINGMNYCTPSCRGGCQRGLCQSPNKCDCEMGFTGTNCNENCELGSWGKNCKQQCICNGLTKTNNCHPKTGTCLSNDEKIEFKLSIPLILDSKVGEESSMKSKIRNNIEINPYMSMNYSGEYAHDYHHYMKTNETDPQKSVNMLVDAENNNEFLAEDIKQSGGVLYVELPEHTLEKLRHPQYVIDHQEHDKHDETVAVVTVGCLLLGMFVFLMLVVYIRKMNKRLPERIPDIESYHNKHDHIPMKFRDMSEPLPSKPLKPILHKTKSVSFDESIDEVDEVRERAPIEAMVYDEQYDIPRKNSSMLDLCPQHIKIRDVAVFPMSHDNAFNTFPRKKVSRKQSLEHIYEEIAFTPKRKMGEASRSNTTQDLRPVFMTNPHLFDRMI